jgi:tripartite-type tricarboxylate transporter receptor subunit TctC
MMRYPLTHALLFTTVIAGFVAINAHAADYPTKPVRMVLPFPPGGGSDTLARILAPSLGEATGQQWVVDNRSGAGGNIAAEIVAKAAPDGYTVMLTLNSVLTMNPWLYPDMRVDVDKDLQPVTQLSLGQYMIVLHPSVPASSAKEFLQLARSKPNALRYASSGVGSNPHLAGELLRSVAKIEMVHVPYKGAGPSVVATLMGEVQLTFASGAASLPHVKSGRLKAVAVTGLKRSKIMPDLLTLDESGVPGYNVISWHAFVAPAKTPAVVIEKIHQAARTVAKLPVVADAMGRDGMENAANGPAALAALIKTESATWRAVIKAANIRGE